MGVEKVLLSKLLKKGANKQIATISEHAGMAFSGFGVSAAPAPLPDYQSTILLSAGSSTNAEWCGLF